jgi:putative ABC transport system permease protein
MDILLQDIRYAARKLVRAPGFTMIAVATLALAIGATTAVFSIVNGVLLKPLPFRAPHELVRVGSSGRDGKLTAMSAPDFVDYREQARSFVGMAPFISRNSANLSIAGSDPLRLNSASVGAKFFDLLAVNMQAGRGFITGEDAAGAQRVAVISDKLWRREFAADKRVVGRSVLLNGEEHTIVGVAPASLSYPSQPDVWLPFVLEPWMIDPSNRGSHFLSAIARVRPGVDVEVAKREMATIGARLAKEYPRSNNGFGGTAQSLHESLVGDVRKLLLTMFGAVAFVLLIACANVANLLLVRAAGRETEMAVRTALGAGRSRIVRQLITESLILSAASAMIGGALAGWTVDAIVAFGPKGLPRLDEIVVDLRVLGFSVLVALLTGLVFGLIPAMHSARSELGQMLKESVRASSGRRAATRTRGALVVSEMALAVVLLVGAGLLIRSFVKLMNVDPGFQTDRIVSFDVSLPVAKYPDDRTIRRYADQVRSELSALPGTQSVAVAFARPMHLYGMRAMLEVEGRAPAPLDKRMVADIRPASANFFSTLGIRMLRGRALTPAEESFGPPPAVVVTQSFVKKFFPNEDPIGKRIKIGISHDTAGPGTPVKASGEIVGIINDIHQKGLNDDLYPAVYIGWGTYPISDISFLVRSKSDTRAMSAAIRERVRAVDPQIPIFDLNSMDDVVSESVAQPRFYMTLLSAFAGLALLLAALGIYGVISYTVSQRTRELGIRIALGATQDRVVRLVIGQGVALTLTGIALGLVGSYWLVQLISTLLFEVPAKDSATFGAVAALLLGVAAMASYLPARRAARVDPVIAMRAE